MGTKGGVGGNFDIIEVGSMGPKIFGVDQENAVGLNVLLFNHPL